MKKRGKSCVARGVSWLPVSGVDFEMLTPTRIQLFNGMFGPGLRCGKLDPAVESVHEKSMSSFACGYKWPSPRVPFSWHWATGCGALPPPKKKTKNTLKWKHDQHFNWTEPPGCKPSGSSRLRRYPQHQIPRIFILPSVPVKSPQGCLAKSPDLSH